MNMLLNLFFETARIHQKRIEHSKEQIKKNYPLTPDSASNLDDKIFSHWEVLISRFSKLQDLLGAKIIPEVLNYIGEGSDQQTYIDRLNKLEKLEIIDSVKTWIELRTLRNHLAHEYPNAPDLTAEYLNQAYDKSSILIKAITDLEILAAKRDNLA